MIITHPVIEMVNKKSNTFSFQIEPFFATKNENDDDDDAQSEREKQH